MACVIGPENFARTAAGSIVWTAAEDLSDLVVLQDGSSSAGDSTTDMYDFSDYSGVLTNTLVNQCAKSVWKQSVCNLLLLCVITLLVFIITHFWHSNNVL